MREIQNAALPKGWEMTTLLDISSKLVDGSHNPPPKQGAGLPMLSAVNVNDNKIAFSDHRLISEDAFQVEDKRTRITSGDVLLTIVGAIGRAAVVQETTPRFTLQRSVAVITPLHVVPKFLMYQIGAPCVAQYFKNNARGTAQKGVYLKTLGQTEIHLPPLNEQHRIVAKIEELFSELDKGIENLKTAREQLKVYRQALLKHAFEGKLTVQWRAANPDKLEPAAALLARIQTEREQRYRQQLQQWEQSKSPSVPLLQRGKTSSAASVPPFAKGGLGGIPKPKAPKPLPPLTAAELAELPELPEGWGWEKLGNIADLIGGVTKGKDLEGKEKISLPYLRVANVQDGYLDLTEIKNIEVELQDKDKYRLEYGDVLYTEGGDKDKLGRGAVWRTQIESCIHQNHIFRARIFGGVISPEILSLYSQTKSAKKYFFRHAKQTTNLASINLTVLSNLPVAIFSQSEQKQILQEIEARLSEAEQLELTLTTALQQSEALRQSILKRAFSGQLVAQDANDEPAAALLARIRAEKEAQSAAPRKTGKGKA